MYNLNEDFINRLKETTRIKFERYDNVYHVKTSSTIFPMIIYEGVFQPCRIDDKKLKRELVKTIKKYIYNSNIYMLCRISQMNLININELNDVCEMTL